MSHHRKTMSRTLRTTTGVRPHTSWMGALWLIPGVATMPSVPNVASMIIAPRSGMSRRTWTWPSSSKRKRRSTTSIMRRGAVSGKRARKAARYDGRMRVVLPDGGDLELPDGATGHQAAEAIGPGLARAAVAVRVTGGEPRDLALPLAEGDRIELVTDRSGDDYLRVMRHSAAHVLAEAVGTIVPGAKLGFGPAIADGFYYDFDLPRP